jgi:hypothetical protein
VAVSAHDATRSADLVQHVQGLTRRRPEQAPDISRQRAYSGRLSLSVLPLVLVLVLAVN